jgi:hypothetical protein
MQQLSGLLRGQNRQGEDWKLNAIRIPVQREHTCSERKSKKRASPQSMAPPVSGEIEKKNKGSGHPSYEITPNNSLPT